MVSLYILKPMVFLYLSRKNSKFFTSADLAWLNAPTPFLKLRTPCANPFSSTPGWQLPLSSADSGKACKRPCHSHARILAPQDLFNGISC